MLSPPDLESERTDERTDGPAAGEVLSATWLVGDVIGAGGMATVHAATGLQGERAALKVMRPHHVLQPGALQRFLREGVLARRIDHPGMVRCLGEGTTDDGCPYLALELLEGCTIEDYFKSAHRPSLQNLLWLFVDVLDLIALCHRQGVVHRDLKPSNLFVTRFGKMKVLDFGVAAAEGMSSDFVRPGVALGTPSFMAPEQAMGAWEHVDARADVFSLGATLFTLLSGRRLHHGKTEAESFTLAATRSAPSLATAAPDLPTEIITFVDRALQWDKRSRFADAGAMKEVLELIALGLDEDDAPVIVPFEEDAASGDEAQVESETGVLCAEAFGLLQDAWHAQERGLGAEETVREAAEGLVRAAQGDAGWSLAVLPWCLRLRDETVWVPDGPLADVLQRMFTDGVRSIETAPGFSSSGVESLLRSLLRHAELEPSQRTDLVCALWPLESEGIRTGVAWGMLGATSSCVGLVEDGRRTVLRILEASGGVSERPSALGAARAASEVLLDEAARASWKGLLPRTEREMAFARHLVAALREVVPSAAAEHEASVLLRTVAQDLLQDGRDDLLLLVAAELSNAPGAVAALLLPDAIGALLASVDRSAKEGRRRGEHFDATVLERVLGALGPAAVPCCLRVLPHLSYPRVSDAVVGHVASCLPLHVEQVGEVLVHLTGETGYRMVRALVERASDVAGHALEDLARHESSPLRVAADAAIHGIEHAEPLVLEQLHAPGWRARVVALRMVQDHLLVAAEPVLVKLIEDAGFHRRTREERVLTLRALHAASPDAAELAAQALVRRHGLIRNDMLDESRMVASELLGEMSASDATVEALRGAESPMWWNPPRIREAARAARKRVEARATEQQGGKPRPIPKFSTLPPPVASHPPPPRERLDSVPPLRGAAKRAPSQPDFVIPVDLQQVARFLVALARLVDLVREGKADDVVRHAAACTVDAVRQHVQTGGTVHVTLAAGVPFVGRTPMRAAAWVFRQIEPLAAALHAQGWWDLRVDPLFSPNDAIALAAAIAKAPELGPSPPVPHVQLGHDTLGDLATVVPIDRDVPSSTLGTAYASVVSTLWDARAWMTRGEMPQLERLLRSSQTVVELAATRRLAATTPTGGRLREDGAARWLDATLLAVEMIALLEPDRVELRDVALAGLLLSLAPFDERGAVDQDGPPSVTRGGRLGAPDRLAARTLGLLVGIPRVCRLARLAASLAAETQVRRYRHLGSPNAVGVSFPAVALATAIRFFELSAKRSEGGADGVVAALRGECADEADELAMRLLLSALGAVPRGAVVELNSREVGVVLSPAIEGIPFEPEVEVLVDGAGKKLSTPYKVDVREAGPRRAVKTVLGLWRGDELPVAGSRDRVKPGVAEEAKPKPKAPAKRPSKASQFPLLGEDILEDFGESTFPRASKPPEKKASRPPVSRPSQPVEPTQEDEELAELLKGAFGE